MKKEYTLDEGTVTVTLKNKRTTKKEPVHDVYTVEITSDKSAATFKFMLHADAGTQTSPDEALLTLLTNIGLCGAHDSYEELAKAVPDYSEEQYMGTISAAHELAQVITPQDMAILYTDLRK